MSVEHVLFPTLYSFLLYNHRPCLIHKSVCCAHCHRTVRSLRNYSLPNCCHSLVVHALNSSTAFRLPDLSSLRTEHTLRRHNSRRTQCPARPRKGGSVAHRPQLSRHRILNTLAAPPPNVMRSTALLGVLPILPLVYSQGAPTSSKRGLVHVPSVKYPADDSIWSSSSSDLTWYYNYRSTPSPAYGNSAKLQFVPMLWGAPSDPSDNRFLNDVQDQIRSGTNITYVLAFNEPDAQANGGSGVPADLAAQAWIREIEPLRKQGVKLGAPAVTGAPTGFLWLQNFFTACKGNCTADFIPVHWYGNFEGLASHIGQVRATYPNMTIWVTEYANAAASLEESQSFYNQSSQYFDRIEYVTSSPVFELEN